MKTARVVRQGREQFIFLPPEFRFHRKAVEIVRNGNEVILRNKRNNRPLRRSTVVHF